MRVGYILLGIAVLVFLRNEAHSASLFEEVDCKDSQGAPLSDASGLIQNLLKTKRVIVTSPSCSIKQSIILKPGQSLQIASGAVVTYSGSVGGSAFILEGDATLNGSGRIVNEAPLSLNSPTTGILITGNSNQVEMGTIANFEQGIYLCSGCMDYKKGVSYNDIRVQAILESIKSIRLNAYFLPRVDPNRENPGWVNQNYIHVSEIRLNPMSSRNTSVYSQTYGIYIDSESSSVPNTNRFSGSVYGPNTGIYLTGMYNRLEGLVLSPINSASSINSARMVVAETSYGSRDCGIRKTSGIPLTKNNWWLGESFVAIDVEYARDHGAQAQQIQKLMDQAAQNPRARVLYENCLDRKSDAVVSFGVEGRDS